MKMKGLSDKDEVEDLTKEFIAESEEGLDRMERCLTLLELRPDDPELLGEIFRAVHSIKGTTGFLGFERLEALAHVGESLLELVRSGRIAVTGELISTLLALLDGLRSILRLIDETGTEGERREDEDHALIAMLRRLTLGSTLNGKAATQERQKEVVSSIYLPTEDDFQRNEEAVRWAGAGSTGSSERTLRVDVDVLNRMMNLVGELVLTRNQLLQTSLDTQGFAQAGRRLNAVTTELRETVMQARMQPVGNVFSKFPRLVRDLAQTCGKKVRIEFAGQETGLDKSLLEAIKGPVTHAVRNAVDHGIEQPGVRLAAGKQEEGVLRLRAFHQGGAVVIELNDDGAGIAVERVRETAVERRLVTRERAAAMTDTEVVQMVFLPGFSTATEVTNVSGRGVGMDVVRSNVEKAGGSVELETLAGRGTTLRMRIPLTLAIIPALVVMSGGQSFAIPQNMLVELVYAGPDEAQDAFVRIDERELYRLRGQLLPVIRLDRLLEIVSEREAGEGGVYLAVLEVDGCRFGLMLDDLLAPEEIVVKPLSRALREIGLFSGATVLGNGTLALILDVAAVAARAGVNGAVDEVRKEQARGTKAAEQMAGEHFLLFREAQALQEQTRAIPLAKVERIETIAVSTVEYARGVPVLRYRGRRLPLTDRGAVLETSETATVLICTRADGSGTTGLVVAEVFHVVNGSLIAETATISGTPLALLDGRLTEVEQLDGPEVESSVLTAAAGEVA